MELFIKVYETCTKCKGTGWEGKDKWGEPDTCDECCQGIIEKFVKLGRHDFRNLFPYLENKIKKGEYKRVIVENHSV